MAKTTKRNAVAVEFAYEPKTWNEQQRIAHVADSLEEAFNKASCLCSGWYRRAVTIDWHVTENNDEAYMIRPSEIAVLDGWSAGYTVSDARGSK